MNNLREKIEKCRADIKKKPEVFKGVRAYFGDPITDDAILEIERVKGVKLPEAMVAFYKTIDQLQVQWDYYGESKISGIISIPPLSILFDNVVSAYSNSEGTGHYPFCSKTLPEFIKRELAEFWVLDDLAGGNAVLFKLDPNTNQPVLYLFTYLNSLTPLKLNFTEYIERALEAHGMFLWQQYFTREAHFKNNLAVNDDLLANMELLFPDSKEKFAGMITQQSSAPKVIKKVDYRDLFTKQVEKLAQKNKVTIKEFKLYSGASAFYLSKAQEALQKKLPESMLNFYSCTNGLKLAWEWDNKYRSNINILPLQTIFAGEYPNIKIEWLDPDDHKDFLWFDDFEDEDIEFLKTVRPFERWPGVSEEVVISFQNEDPEFHFLIARGENRKMKLTFEEYLEYLITFLGFRYWPALVTGGENVIIGDRPLKELLSEIFPEIDVEKYIKK